VDRFAIRSGGEPFDGPEFGPLLRMPSHSRAVFGGLETEVSTTVLKAQDLQRRTAEPALYVRSVCWITTAFRGLRCHPLTCMLLNIPLSADSIPSALTNLYN
jgi:hypothetical protein